MGCILAAGRPAVVWTCKQSNLYTAAAAYAGLRDSYPLRSTEIAFYLTAAGTVRPISWRCGRHFCLSTARCSGSHVQLLTSSEHLGPAAATPTSICAQRLCPAQNRAIVQSVLTGASRWRWRAMMAPTPRAHSHKRPRRC